MTRVSVALTSLTLVGMAALGGCSAENESGPALAVMTDEQSGADDALLSGELAAVGDCVVVTGSDQGEIIVVLWPTGSTVETSGEGWSLTSSALADDTVEGRQVQVGGGFRDAAEAPEATIPSPCEAERYWIAADDRFRPSAAGASRRTGRPARGGSASVD